MRKVLLGLVLVIAGAISLLIWALSDPNRFKPELTSLIEDQTGLKVAIDGQLSWRLWPPVQLLAAGIRADWQDPDQAPLVSVTTLRLDADLMPLLSANPKLKVDGITIDGLHANLVQTGEVANWTPPGMAETPPPVPLPDPNAPGPPDWQIASITLTDALIEHTQDGSATRVAFEELRLSDIAPDKPVPIRATGMLSGPVEALPFELSLKAQLGKMAERVSITDGALTLADAELGMTFDAEQLSTAPIVRGRITMVDQPIADLLSRFDVVHDQPLGVDVEFTADPDQVSVDNMTLTALGSHASGSASYSLAEQPPRLKFALNVDRVRIEAAPEETPTLALGGGPGLLSMFGAPVSVGTSLDTADEPLLPLDTLRNLDWQGTVEIAELIYDDAAFPNTHLKTRNRSGLINATLAMPSFFGGSATNKIRIDARKDKPVWRVTPKLEKVDSEPLMVWLDQKLYWAALLLADGSFEMRGNTERELLESISGKSHFDGGQGIMDITRIKRAMQTIATLAGGSERIDTWPERLEYQRLIGDWQVDGSNHRMNVALDNMKLAMNGSYDPFTDLMDMAIDLTIVDDPELDTFQVNSTLMGLAIPMRCTGPSTDPSCRADEAGVRKLVADALTGQAGSEATERLDTIIDEQVPEEYKESARSLLRNFGELLKQNESQQQNQQP